MLGNAPRGATVAIEHIAVITLFKGRIDDTVAAAADRTIGSAVRIRRIGIEEAVVTLLPGIHFHIPAERRQQRELRRVQTATENAALRCGTVGVGRAGDRHAVLLTDTAGAEARRTLIVLGAGAAVSGDAEIRRALMIGSAGPALAAEAETCGTLTVHRARDGTGRMIGRRE